MVQLVDDLLDFTATAEDFGKPSQGADLKLGLATAPALYAWKEFPELGEMILRKFENEGDVERTRVLVNKSSGPAQTIALAEHHAKLAFDALKGLPESEAREALEGLTKTVLSRTK
jgi:hexaprenyl-diphosphate synthase